MSEDQEQITAEEAGHSLWADGWTHRRCLKNAALGLRLVSGARFLYLEVWGGCLRTCEFWRLSAGRHPHRYSELGRQLGQLVSCYLMPSPALVVPRKLIVLLTILVVSSSSPAHD